MRRDFYVISFSRGHILLSWLCTFVKFTFSFCGFACGNDSNDIATCTFTVTNEQKPGVGAHAQQKKALFMSRMVLVKELDCKVVVKHGLCFLKRNSMLFTVNRFLVLIPFKCNPVSYTHLTLPTN